jgi:signal transduction histidine kinase
MIVMAVTPALILMLYMASVQRRAERAEAEDAAFKIVRLAVGNYQHYLVMSQELLSVLSHLPEIDQRDVSGCSTLFRNLLGEYPLYANLFAVLPNGDLFCSGVETTEHVNVADRLWFHQALKTSAFVVSNYETGHVTHNAVIIMAQPFLDRNGQLQGVVGVSLDLAWLQEFAAPLLPSGWNLALLDERGTSLVDYPRDEARPSLPASGRSGLDAAFNEATEGAFESRDLEGVTRLFVFARAVDHTGAGQLTVLVSAPAELAYDEANESLSSNLLWLGVVTFLSVGGALAAGDLFVLRQVRDLQSAVHRLREGDVSAQARASGGARELQEVATAFNQMAGAVQQRDADLRQAREELEARVAERTAELSQANVALQSAVAERRRKEDALQQSQAQLVQAEKMTALGRLAASLAHEINNPLQAVQTHLDLLTMGITLPPATQDQYLRVAQAEIERLGRLVVRILDFARPARTPRHPVSVVTLVEQTIVLSNKRLQEARIRLVTDFQPVPLVLAAPDQLVQVFLNLLLNAIEAVKEGGTISIATRRVGDDVAVSVADSGPSIPLDDLQHIFEPFFSTKPGGTGLGLSISHTLVREHGGVLSVVNDTGEYGALFIVTLPGYFPSQVPDPKEIQL